jgi:hypothetical protein
MDKRYDIYHIESLTNKINGSKYENTILLDKNSVFIKKHDIKIYDKLFQCKKCNKLTDFVHHTDKGIVCPQCSFFMSPNKKCDDCGKHICCYNCGNVNSEMIKISNYYFNELILCYDNVCLKNFGFNKNKSEKTNCTCILNNCKILQGFLPNDIYYSICQISSPTNTKIENINIDCNVCSPIEKKYMTAEGIIKKNICCNC